MRKIVQNWPAIAFAAALIMPLTGAMAAEPAKDEGPTDVEMPPILAPIVVDNRLDSYAYITIKLTPSTRDKVFTIREKVPFLRDGFLREVNKTGITKADDPKAVDTKALKARLMARLNQILPAGTVGDLKFDEIVLTPIEPRS